MRRLLCFIFCLIISLNLIGPAFAADSTQGTIIRYQETDLGDGITVVDEIIDYSSARSTDKTYAHVKTIKNDGTTIGTIAIRGTFRYDGTTVSVVSKSVTQTDTYDGWSYKQNSFTSSSGTITLDAKLTKLLVLNISFTMTLSCDKNGNISYK